jgi:hypothetical protein
VPTCTAARACLIAVGPIDFYLCLQTLMADSSSTTGNMGKRILLGTSPNIRQAWVREKGSGFNRPLRYPPLNVA